MQKFYFTFGSDEQFPYQNGYLIVMAEDLKAAIEKFRKKYPDRTKDTVNCAFWYTEEQWKKGNNKISYGDAKEIIK